MTEDPPTTTTSSTSSAATAAPDSPSGKELPIVASPESQTPALTAVITEDLDHDEPQLEEESPGWENEDGSSTSPIRNHFRIRREDPMRGSFMQLLRGRAAPQPSRSDSDLHPVVQTLGLRDLESCLALENACFPEHERESRETFIYRLTTAPELTLGLFSTLPSSSSTTTTTDNPTKTPTLLAMIIATQTTTPYATDESMAIPPSFHSQPPPPPPPPPQHQPQQQQEQPPGHIPTAPTLILHSLAVHPSHQRRGLGRTLLKSYQQRMEGARIAERIALIARGDGTVAFYTGCGFEERGESGVQWAGGGWRSLVYELGEGGG